MNTYTWKHAVAVWKQQTTAAMTGLTFNEFLEFYFECNNQRYVLVKMFGDR